MSNLRVYLILVALLAVSCTNHVYRQTGLDMQITPASGGTTSLTVNNVNDITLTGEVQLDSGAFRLVLVNPAGITVKQVELRRRTAICYRLETFCDPRHMAHQVCQRSRGGQDSTCDESRYRPVAPLPARTRSVRATSKIEFA